MYAISNASTSGQDDNTLTKYTNHLSEPLTFSDRAEWKMCLRSLFMSNNLLSKYDTDFLQIRCDQLSANNASNQIISLHSKRPSAKHVTMHHWTPRNVEWFHPISNYIDHLSFTLLDNHSEQIQLSPGQPTIILLEFKKIMNQTKEFVVRVSSRPTLEYPDNKPHHFSANLPLEYSYFAQSPFEIAVSSMTYTPAFQKVYVHHGEHLEFSIIEGEGEEEERRHTYRMPITDTEFCSCDSELVWLLNQHFQIFAHDYGEEHGFEPIKMELDEETNRVILFTPSNENEISSILSSEIGMEITFPRSIAIRLGMFNKIMNNAPKMAIRLHPGLMAKGEFSMNVNALLPRSIVLYTNFTEPVLTGSGKSSILKIFPISETMITNPSHLTQETETLEFYRIDQSELTNLQFKLYQISGDRVHFQNEEGNEIILSLIIRQRE